MTSLLSRSKLKHHSTVLFFFFCIKGLFLSHTCVFLASGFFSTNMFTRFGGFFLSFLLFCLCFPESNLVAEPRWALCNRKWPDLYRVSEFWFLGEQRREKTRTETSAALKRCLNRWLHQRGFVQESNTRTSSFCAWLQGLKGQLAFISCEQLTDSLSLSFFFLHWSRGEVFITSAVGEADSVVPRCSCESQQNLKQYANKKSFILSKKMPFYTNPPFSFTSFYFIFISAPKKGQEIQKTCLNVPVCFITPDSSGTFGVGMNRRCKAYVKLPASKDGVFSKEEAKALDLTARRARLT